MRRRILDFLPSYLIKRRILSKRFYTVSGATVVRYAGSSPRECSTPKSIAINTIQHEATAVKTIRPLGTFAWYSMASARERRDSVGLATVKSGVIDRKGTLTSRRLIKPRVAPVTCMCISSKIVKITTRTAKSKRIASISSYLRLVGHGKRILSYR